ncbi:UbiA prenyltransferase family protein [Patescibacteria group bacterium]
MKKLNAILRLTRWREYYGKVLLASLLGFFLVGGSFWTGFFLILANLLSGAFVFMINDVEDADDDALDSKKKKRNPVSSGDLSKNESLALTALVGFGSLFFYTLFDKWVFLIGFVGLVLGFLYSYKRVRLKSKPIVDITSHGIFMALVYFMAAIYTSDTLPSIVSILWLGVPIYLISVLGDLGNEIRDYQVDRKAGLKNTANYVNITKFKKLLIYPTAILFFTILFYIFLNSGVWVNIAIAISGAGVFVHYKYRWHGKRQVFHYPYSQEVFAALGLILFAGAGWGLLTRLI